MTHEQLEQDYQAVLAALRDEKNKQISEYQAQAWAMAQRASKAESERDVLQARIDGALAALQKYTCYSAVAHAIEILTGEGES